MGGTTGRFRPADRILDSRDFKRISREGSRTGGRDFVFIVAEPRTHDGGTRMGVSVSRRVGNAVVRNRVKRRIREWFRRERKQLPAATELVVIARQSAAELDTGDMHRALDELMARALRKRSTAQSQQPERTPHRWNQ